MKIDIKDITGKIVGEVEQETASRAFRAANELKNSALNVLKNDPKRTGREYRKPHTKKAKYTASAPGEPPANRSGMLRMSWSPVSASERTAGSFVIKPAISTSIKYAPYLQEGTPKIKPRPFEQPIIDGAKDKVMAIFSEPYLNK